MSELLTMQDLANGHLDVKALGEAANGDENTIVTTRTGNTYPSVKKAIKTMFDNGGFPASPFETKALMTASSLADGDYAWVTDDADDNNGLYIKRAGVWVFSEFNALKRVQDYVKQLNAKVMLQDDVYLDAYEDKNGSVYRYTDADGEMYVTGLDKSGSVQQNINTLNEAAPSLLDDAALAVFTDTNDVPYAYFDLDGNLHLSNSLYVDNKPVGQTASTDLDRLRHQSILLGKPKIKTVFDVATKLEDGLIKRMPSATKTPTGLVYFYHKQIEGFDGDMTGSELWKAIITIDASLNITVNSRELFASPDAPRGIVKHPMLGRTSDNRILLIFEKRVEPTDSYVRYQCYSSDEGLTFTVPTLSNITNISSNERVALGTTGVITTAPSGRLIVPMYAGDGGSLCIYSEDDGVTWKAGNKIDTVGASGVEPSITFDLDGNLQMDLRPRVVGETRGRAISKDEGKTWHLLSASTPSSATNQGTLFTDASIGALIQTHNNTEDAYRKKYSLSLSYDNGATYPYIYKPYDDEWYGGYSHIIKWSDGIYIIPIEYNEEYQYSTNFNENSGLLILSLSEVLSNVNYN